MVLPAPAFLGIHEKIITATPARLRLSFRLPEIAAGSLARGWDQGELPLGAPCSLAEGEGNPGGRHGVRAAILGPAERVRQCLRPCVTATSTPFLLPGSPNSHFFPFVRVQATLPTGL